jgi:cytochrome oxidase assembly protein ShyY1
MTSPIPMEGELDRKANNLLIYHIQWFIFELLGLAFFMILEIIISKELDKRVLKLQKEWAK